jgi:primosomal protein N' (replication factor Y)
MGSATPSVEAYHLMSEGGIASYSLPERLAGGRIPEVAVVDMKREKGGISATLASEIRTTVDGGRQVILFLNRRGFSYFFHCRSCGYEMTCSRCSVSLTFHKERNRMICHYCGNSREPVEVCPECGSLDVGYSGFGTEMVEEEVKRRFPTPFARRAN